MSLLPSLPNFRIQTSNIDWRLEAPLSTDQNWWDIQLCRLSRCRVLYLSIVQAAIIGLSSPHCVNQFSNSSLNMYSFCFFCPSREPWSMQRKCQIFPWPSKRCLCLLSIPGFSGEDTEPCIMVGCYNSPCGPLCEVLYPQIKTINSSHRQPILYEGPQRGFYFSYSNARI